MTIKFYINNIIFILLIILLTTSLLLFSTTKKAYASDFVESNYDVINPDKGFYTVLTKYETGKEYILSDENISNECIPVYKRCQDNLINLVNIKIHIKPGTQNNYKITECDIINLNKYFEFARKYNLKVIPRAAYIWDSNSLDKEPTDITIIHENIKALCNDIYNKNSNEITVVQAGIFGMWGEMHPSDLLNNYLKDIINTYLKYLESHIQISIRRPSYYREIFNKTEPINQYNSHTGTNESRVGFYNDGYLSTETDYGTYTDWTREMELDFQNFHNSYTVFGGEVSISNYSKPPYGADIFVAVNDMRKTHLTYLNSEWNIDFFKYWKTSSIYNQSGFDYIKNHLGYRFVLRQSDIPEVSYISDYIDMKIAIENTGFSNIINNNLVQIIFEKDNIFYTINTLEDPRFWQSNETTYTNIKVKIPKECTEGMWNIYMKLPDRSKNDNLSIRFANRSGFNENLHANLLGSTYLKNNVSDNNFSSEGSQDDKDSSDIISPATDTINAKTYDSHSSYIYFLLTAFTLTILYEVCHKSLSAN